MSGLGAVLLALVVIFLAGRLWFRFVEAILDRIKRLFSGRGEPPAWHPFPEREEDEPRD